MVKVRGREFLDQYVEDGESAVLVDDKVFVLSSLATTILESADDWTSVPDVAAQLESVYGAPPEGDLMDATTTAVETLVEQGLLATTV